MFDYIKGTVEYITEDMLVLENNGIGYQIMTSAFVTNHVLLHETYTIYTYMHVREDGITVFGFLNRDDIQVFKYLISVSGIGPKGALAIMSVLTIDELRIAILSDDYKAIAKANGVGPKTAQRVIMDLRDKFKLEDVIGNLGNSNDLPESSCNDIISETAMALTSLGYSNVEALKAIKKVENSEDMTVEQLLSAALKKIV